MQELLRKPLLLRAQVGIAAFCVGFGIAFAIWSDYSCNRKYAYINEDIICGSKDAIEKTEYTETHDEIQALIAEERDKGRILTAGVYFRDLKHGPLFGINENLPYAPASLLKLPLAVVFLSTAEGEPEVLTQKISYQGIPSQEEVGSKPVIKALPGMEYTIEELLRMMIIDSDNASYEALEAFLHKSESRLFLRKQVFQELGLISPTDRVEETLSVRGYASIFRILYNASYLNWESTEKLLSWLGESDFKEGLEAGIPARIRVAHKYGARLFSDDTKQLHDCGIVYFPKNPYILCIMTRGNDWDHLSALIGKISKIVYDEVESRKL
jgi:beta-lactamase class A